ncbi:bifunctional GNAT family N-acetyltransferase/hotdog fold thioesterase [Rheinheimera sp.]|uniref:bifunctional GNAT family N-acetyltransferase/hotdog fold thioesterase n=1 Tax=Rheinheimera sp. TaxID=1869214 RepID=UPI00273237D5|nr:bifunctional GNAT family N-acetyltransferase/hotdog fold thioesterase [Rheinheimera sp.]MDP2714922.1 bifunctional GNAT family N-acetyltransferase/hotdog fold thioesterase [Rheinheimera sp.]
MRHWQLRSPQTPEEWQGYYQLRWQVLRAPWQQPPGSERDELEAQAYHLMLMTAEGKIAAVGRLHQLEQGGAQIRYMAVAEEYQGKGAGSKVLAALEMQAVQWGCSYISLNARDTALQFYQRQGYLQAGAAPQLYGIAHVVMQKRIRLAGTAQQHQLWCKQLADTWQRTIPLSQYMQLAISNFDGNELCCEAPLAPNINLHQTMFAGSIYALATLTGWGMLYLQLQALGLHGDQVLADASINYRKPVAAEPQARCALQHCSGALTALAEGRKVVQQIKVQIFSAGELAAEFNGRYAVLPAHRGAR